MKQEDRQLLLKDLCTRLPYGVIVDYKENEFEIPHWKINVIYPETMDGWIGYDEKVGVGSKSGSRPFNIGEYKPFLRPMSSMTEEEEKEYRKTMDKYTHRLYPNSADFSEHTEYSWTTETFDFLNAHHLDYRGLIPMGLAIEAPKGMYNI